MKTKKAILTISVLILLGICLVGCKKSQARKNQKIAQEYTLANNIFDDLLYVVNRIDDTEEEIEDIAKSGLTDTCFTHTNYSCLTICKEYIDVDNWEWKITIDFGSAGCVIGDGVTRKGKLIAHRKGRFRLEGSTTTITTENYFVNEHEVTGERTITNIGRNTNNQLQYSISETGEIISSNGTTTWNSQRTNTWLQGSETWTFGTLNDDGTIDELFWNWPDGVYDDVWEIAGEAQGTTSNAINFEASISNPLIIQWCSPNAEITKGSLLVSSDDINDIVVNYGNGVCDNEGSISVNGNERSFNFR